MNCHFEPSKMRGDEHFAPSRNPLLILPQIEVENVQADLAHRRGSRLAFGTRADFAQEVPGVDSEIVVVIPRKLDGVFTHALSRNRFGRRFEDGQGAGSKLRRITRLASGLPPLFFAHRAGTCVAQIEEAVSRNVAVAPLDLDAASGADIYLHRLGIGRGSRGLQRRLHGVSIACWKRRRFRLWNQPTDR